jgi:hypothetical protein
MPFDFSKLSSENSTDTVISPRDIFTVLPNKDPKYQYPRDVQGEVWGAWFERRNERDLVLRMNTGGGKTVVGLIILKSCLNEGKGPAVYVAPDQYLAKQVNLEAASLGLETTDDKNSARFESGKAILVTTIRTIVNGQSGFGVGQEGIQIPIGSLIIDDAHACLETTESQFTLVFDGTAHERFLDLFKTDLEQQSEALAAEVVDERRGRYMQVPYWAWVDRQSAVIKLINEIGKSPKNDEKDEYGKNNRDAVLFNFPLIRDVLRLCRCVIGDGSVEISPRILPISVIPAFANAERRIVMSATLADDSVLVSHFDWATTALSNPITPQTANDIGDRLILIPQELNPTFTDENLKGLFSEMAKSRNVVVIVPSGFRAQFWKDKAALILTAENLEDGVKKLKNGHVGLTVLVNKYDGIDLPKKACEVLVIDGLPDVRRGIDKLEEGVLLGSDYILSQRIQRIEQGMGRGVRSNEDHCLVFLMGKTLTSFLYKPNAKKKFGSATRAQMALSQKMGDDLYNGPITALGEVAKSFFKRDKHWVAASKSALVHLKYENNQSSITLVQKQRDAFACATRNDAAQATRLLNEAVNAAADDKTKGWLIQQLAEYTHLLNPTESQVLLRSAVSTNPRVLRPREGIDYKRLAPSTAKQAERCALRLKKEYASGNHLIVAVNGMIDKLIFLPETSESFEQTMSDVGWLLGFDTQRPEKEFGRGPDVLWEAGEMSYFVIECKNGVTSDNPINKHDCNQLNGSVVWFQELYDATCSCVPILIHPITEHEHAASLHENTRIMTAEKLERFKEAVRQFAVSTSTANWGDTKAIATLLQACNLTKVTITNFTVSPRRPAR